VLQKLGREIVCGHYLPGTTLSDEVTFAHELQISRGAYREAMQVLASKGLVESRPKLGTRVLPRHRWNILDPDVLAWAFSGKPDIELVRDIFELRATIEPAAARLAAQRRTKADIEVLKLALTGMRHNSLASEAGRVADREFHHGILQATHNGAMAVLSASICAAVSWTTQFKHEAPALPRNPLRDHVRVYEAIASGNAHAAADSMRILVDLALEDTKTALGS